MSELGGIERIDLGEVPYEATVERMTGWVERRRFTACGLPEVAMTSLAELAARQGRPAPSEKEVRDAVAEALGAA
jgi:hypothetical protein